MAHMVLAVGSWLNISNFIDLFNEAKNRYNQYRVYKSTVRELSRLSDKELNDIGINRGMIHSIAMDAYLDVR